MYSEYTCLQVKIKSYKGIRTDYSIVIWKKKNIKQFLRKLAMEKLGDGILTLGHQKVCNQWHICLFESKDALSSKIKPDVLFKTLGF